MPRPALFLDRDGTLIEDTGFVADPGAVRLLPGAADAVARANRAGLAVIVVTNQSGIARGLLTEEDYHRVHGRMVELLAERGARIDADYFCPHLPALSGPCACRKPATQLYRQAGERFDLDFTRSWWIGDRLRDLEPAASLGGRAVLVRTGEGQREADAGERAGWPVVDGVADAVALMLDATRLGQTPAPG